MKISVELSLYPLREGFAPIVEDYIRQLKNCPDIDVRPNSMSTQIFGDFDAVMGAVQQCTRTAFESDGSLSLVCKFLNTDRSDSDYSD